MRAAQQRLEGRTAVITGGGRGLGRAMALAMAAAGADVVVTARHASEIEETVSMVRAHGVRSAGVVADVASASDVARLRDAAHQLAETVDIVVNNAGNLIVKPFVPLADRMTGDPDRDAGLTYADWRASHAVHLDGAFHVLQAFAPGMLEQRYGRVVNIVSSALGRSTPFTAAYDTAKAALAQLTRSLAFEWARYGVTVNAVAAGQFHTRMSAQLHEDPRQQEWMLKRIPMRRAGDPAELGALVVELVGEEMGFMTGQVVGLDGGETL
jgi:NAD(P)-dependent dehydrogenase (short-subunit alcohol dehydrogenase family)